MRKTLDRITAERIRITYGGDTSIMSWHPSEASAQIYVDGETTGYQTADACHRTEDAVRLICPILWGRMYETAEKADEAGYNPAINAICVWNDVAFEIEKK